MPIRIVMSRTRYLTFGLVLALALALPGRAQCAGQGDYRLGPGDKVRVTVFGEPDLSGEFAVDGSGVIAFPLIGEVRAGAQTARQVEIAITSALRDGYLKKPVVNVEVLTYRPFYILGEVNKPGKYPYEAGMTVLNAVALAEGYTYRARSGRWLITRGGESAMQEHEVRDADFEVLPGDIVTVPERFF